MNMMRDNDDDTSDVPKQSNCQRNYVLRHTSTDCLRLAYTYTQTEPHHDQHALSAGLRRPYQDESYRHLNDTSAHDWARTSDEIFRGKR